MNSLISEKHLETFKQKNKSINWPQTQSFSEQEQMTSFIRMQDNKTKQRIQALIERDKNLNKSKSNKLVLNK